MTREECKNIAEAISFKIGERQRLSLPGVNELIDQIYNDHEAQLKAKDEEIRRLNNLYADTIKDLGDALIEIERLKEAINGFELIV